MRRTVVGLLVASVCLFAACSSDGSAKSSASSAPSSTAPTSSTGGGTPTTVAGAAALQGPEWSLQSVGTQAVPASVEISATFKDGTVNGSAGCNTYRAPYTVNGAQLTIGAVAGTKIACPPPVMAIERSYLAALRKVQTFAITKQGALVLTTSNQRERGPELTYVVQQQEVVGSWNVTGYLTTATDAFTSVLAGTTVTARFDTVGRVSGSGGCNNYGGPYAVTGSKIAIGPLGATLKLCVEPAGIGKQETDFQAALERAKTFTVSGSTLTLFDGQQRRAATMTRAPTS